MKRTHPRKIDDNEMLLIKTYQKLKFSGKKKQKEETFKVTNQI